MSTIINRLMIGFGIYFPTVLITKWCGDIGMVYKCDVGVNLIERDQLLSTLLSREARKGYGYECPSNLRSLR